MKVNDEVVEHIKKNVERILLWNKERNRLKLNISLERRMLDEEAKGFILTDDLAEKLRKYTDYMFAFTGTLHKIKATLELGEMLVETANSYWLFMERELREHFADLRVPEDEMPRMFNNAMDIIINANEMKGVPDEDGRVPDGPFSFDPMPQIRELVKKAIPCINPKD